MGRLSPPMPFLIGDLNLIPWSTRVLNPNELLIGSAIFAGLTSVTDRQTDHAMGNSRPHLRT